MSSCNQKGSITTTKVNKKGKCVGKRPGKSYGLETGLGEGK